MTGSAATANDAADTGPTAIVGGRYLAPDGRLVGPADGLAVVTVSGESIDSVASDLSDDCHRVDGEGLIVSPGFIDLQINGGFGIDLLSEPDGMWELARQLPRHGVTSFLPTIITSPPSSTAAAMKALAKRPAHHGGAEPLGLHFEGPMLSPARPGAHPIRHLAKPDLDLIGEWSRSNGVALVTIAPELHGADEVIAELVSRGVAVSAGHTEATAAEARAAMAVGVTMVTHLFNAMSPLGHRDPNLVGVTLAGDELVASLIVDGVHVAPEVVTTVWKARGGDGLVLITDAVAPMGMGPGTYQLAGTTIIADEERVRTEEGTLAGSVLTMDGAIRNLVAFTGCEPREALRAATVTPATAIGAAERGRIEPGAVADLVLLDDQLEVKLTFCRGRLAYAAADARARVPGQLLQALDSGID